MNFSQYFSSAIRVLLDRMYWGWLPSERLVAMRIGRKIVGVLMYWLGFAAALIAAAAAMSFGTEPDPNGWGPGPTFIFGAIFIIPVVTSLYSIGVALAQFVLPAVDSASAPKYRKASFITGLLFAVPIVLGCNLVASYLSFVGLAWIAGPALTGITYYLSLRHLHAKGWFPQDGRCSDCGYTLAAGTSIGCPECGRSAPSN